MECSYDHPWLYQDFNVAFAKHWEGSAAKSDGQSIAWRLQLNRAARIDGRKPTWSPLRLAYDIDMIAEKAKLLPQKLESRLPDNSSPTLASSSRRKGIPRGSGNWDDLVKPGVAVLPRTRKPPAVRLELPGRLGLWNTGGPMEMRQRPGSSFASFIRTFPSRHRGQGGYDTFIERGMAMC